jgi:hypothetical protein
LGHGCGVPLVSLVLLYWIHVVTWIPRKLTVCGKSPSLIGKATNLMCHVK